MNANERLGHRDEFFWLSQINKASLVINADRGLIDKEDVPGFAAALDAVIRQGDTPGGKRPKKVILYEPMLIAEAGPRITILHAGRSSQDMHSTFRVAMIRDHLLDLMHAANRMAAAMTQMAEEHRDTLVVCYTNGVAAQPNTLGHYLLGLLQGFNRDRERICEMARRIDRCPMGSMVLNGTCWPLDRRRMAASLGFSGIAENCYDGTLGLNVDAAVEFAQLCQGIALHVGTFIQDLSVQYAQSRPWILLQEGGDNTYVSSAMPQKRNPGLMISTRCLASQTMADAGGILIRAHNVVPGMVDPKEQNAATRACESACGMLDHLSRVIAALRVDKERALEELNSDWTASQEMADVLMHRYGLPFRIGHHVASAMVSWARANKVRPLDFPYEQMQAIYREVTAKEYVAGELPFSQEEFRQILNPRSIINNRAVEGGPQPPELERQLVRQQELNNRFETWWTQTREGIDQALGELDAEYRKLLPGNAAN